MPKQPAEQVFLKSWQSLKSTCKGVYFLVKLKLYPESLLKTFEIQIQLFSRNIFQMSATLIKGDSDTGVYLWNVRTLFLKEHLWWLFLNVLWVLSRCVNKHFREYTLCKRTYWKNFSLRLYLKHSLYLPLQLC